LPFFITCSKSVNESVTSFCYAKKYQGITDSKTSEKCSSSFTFISFNTDNSHQKGMNKMNKYLKFLVMILTSTFLMYWLMYLNLYEASHVEFSQTRLFMALIMGSVMAVVMLLFMWKMYEDKKKNIVILIVSGLIFFLSLFLVRSQSTVDQISWMKAMIPHHSIAILTSERADIEDERVKELAKEIIDAQKREIEEMQQLIDELE